MPCYYTRFKEHYWQWYLFVLPQNSLCLTLARKRRSGAMSSTFFDRGCHRKLQQAGLRFGHKWTCYSMKQFIKQLYRFTKVYGTTAAGIVAVVGILVYEKNKNNAVYASWTTNFDPSVKWDHNWDKFVLNYFQLLWQQSFREHLDT